MTNRIILLLTTFLMVVLLSCTQTTAPRIDNTRSVFQGSLVMFDSTGNNPVNGRLSINHGDSTYLSGNWSLQNGQSGKLAGTMTDSTLWINLNPNMIDANTFMFGTFDGTTIKGRWILDGFAGPINHGTFIATSD